MFLEQLAFSKVIDYHDIWIYIPEDVIRNGTNVVEILRKVDEATIVRKREAMLRYSKHFLFPSTGGMNASVDEPNSLSLTLQDLYSSVRAKKIL